MGKLIAPPKARILPARFGRPLIAKALDLKAAKQQKAEQQQKAAR